MHEVRSVLHVHPTQYRVMITRRVLEPQFVTNLCPSLMCQPEMLQQSETLPKVAQKFYFLQILELGADFFLKLRLTSAPYSAENTDLLRTPFWLKPCQQDFLIVVSLPHCR